MSVSPLCVCKRNRFRREKNKPLYTGQDGRHVIGWAPTILQNIETKLPSSVYVRVKHLTDKLDSRRLIGILFLEMHHQTECSIFEGRIGGTNDDGIPAKFAHVSLTNASRYKDRGCRTKS